MSRNFGSPRCIGAETTPGAPSPRVAVSREPIQLAGKTSRPANSRGAGLELSIREYATAFFVGAFLAGIAVCLWFLCLIIDWSGVVEALRQG